MDEVVPGSRELATVDNGTPVEVRPAVKFGVTPRVGRRITLEEYAKRHPEDPPWPGEQLSIPGVS
jgi:hypothetical protein